MTGTTENGERFTGHGSRMARREPVCPGRAHSHILGGSASRQTLDADQQGPRGRCARYHVAAGEGWRDRRPPHFRRASTSPVEVKTLYGWDQTNPDDAPVAPQVLRSVRQHPRLSSLAAVADERVGRRAIWTRPTRLPAPPGTTTAPASAIWRAWPRCSCAISIRPMLLRGRRACRTATTIRLVHCGTSFGNYKEVRQYLLHSAELRER